MKASERIAELEAQLEAANQLVDTCLALHGHSLGEIAALREALETIRLPKYDDELLILLYSEWSEEFWAAGFMLPTPTGVGAFRKWLEARSRYPTETYEIDMLTEFRRQEERAQAGG